MKRLSTMQTSNSEYHVILTYLETLVDLPWGISDKENLDPENAMHVLEKDHYGL
jgi:ATP-dependent Lon protease